MLNYLTRRREVEQIEQQEWIAHEIHDGACQYLTAAQLMFDAFRHERAGIPPSDWGNFEMAQEFLNRASEELRRLVSGLRPIHLAAGDLAKAVECLVEEVRAAGGPDIELCCDIQPELVPERLQLAAFRIVQETLANACRHSKSEGILVGLTQDEESLCVQVQDWGIGFDPDNAPQGHFGLDGIRQRVKLLRGIVTIHSDLGEGTLVTAELPLKE
jgi:signal transduction histidine kinase